MFFPTLARIVCPIVAVLASFLPAFALAEEPGHAMVIPQLAGAAKFGTDLNRAPWTTAARTTGFLTVNTRQVDPYPTIVYACYDRTALWLAYRCEGIDGRSAKTEFKERDGRVWWDDGAEFYCSPDHSRQHFFQFAANAAGVAYDGKDTDGKWNAKWQVASAVDEKGFTIAMRIPFVQMKTPSPKPGQHWMVNFSRHGPISKSSSWVWTYNGLHDTRQYGKLIFGGPSAKVVRCGAAVPVVIGKNAVAVENASGLSCRVVGRDSSTAPIFNTTARAEGGQFVFAIENDAVRSIEILVDDAEGHNLARFWSGVKTPVLTPRLEDWSRRFEVMQRVAAQWPAATAAEARKAIADAKPKLAEARQIASDKAGYSAEAWSKLEATLDDFDKNLGDLSCYARTLENFPNAAFAVGTESAMRKVMISDFPFTGTFDRQASVSLAANEHEGLQVVVIPFRRDLANARVQARVTAPAGIGKIACAVSLVGHVDVNDDPPYDSTYKGFWPDPLLNFLNSASIKAGEHVAFWIDVATSKDTPAGDYAGTIEVTADGCSPISMPLTVKVWGFQLPDGTHLRNAFTYHENPIRGFYKDKWNDEMARAYQDLVLDHRLGIDHLYRHEPPDLATLKRAVGKGMNAFNIVFGGGGGANQRAFNAISEFVPKIREAGLLKLAYVYACDEIKADKFPAAREFFDTVHRLAPGVPTMTTAQDTSFGKETGLRQAVDIWVPLTPSYDMTEAEELRREGKQMWWYVCLVPIHPYANWWVEYPAIEPRLLMGAMSHKYKVDGFLYYMLNLWERNKKPISSGPRTDWDPASCPNSKGKWANGDGNLFYPGPDGPLSTIRLENIRDGLEDYEYLYLLAEQVRRVGALPETPANRKFLDAARPLLAVPDTVVHSVVEYTLDPQSVYDWRTSVAELIVTGQKLGRD